MPVDAHSRQGAPSLLATRYGGPITIRAKEGMPKANLKARRTQRSPLYSGQQHQHCMALALTARGQMHIVLALTSFSLPLITKLIFTANNLSTTIPQGIHLIISHNLSFPHERTFQTRFFEHKMPRICQK